MEYLFVNKSTEDGLNSYGKCKMIERLNIAGTRICEIGVETALRNAPRLQILDHPDVCLVLGKMHGKDLKSNNPLVQYSLTTLRAHESYEMFDMAISLAKSLSVAIGVCPQLTDVNLYFRSVNEDNDVLSPLCQLKNLKNLDIHYDDERREDLFSKVVPVLSASGQSIARLHLEGLPSADVGIIGLCCPILEDLHLYIGVDDRQVRVAHGLVPSRKDTFIPTANNVRPFSFLKFLDVTVTTSYNGMRGNSDIRPSEWKNLLSSRLLESLSINGSSSLTDNLLFEVLKDGQEFPNLRKIQLFNCPNITTGFVRSFLDLQNPLEAIKVMFCKNIPKSDSDSLKSFCKVNHFDVQIHIKSYGRIDVLSDTESDEEDFFLY